MVAIDSSIDTMASTTGNASGGAHVDGLGGLATVTSENTVDSTVKADYTDIDDSNGCHREYTYIRTRADVGARDLSAVDTAQAQSVEKRPVLQGTAKRTKTAFAASSSPTSAAPGAVPGALAAASSSRYSTAEAINVHGSNTFSNSSDGSNGGNAGGMTDGTNSGGSHSDNFWKRVFGDDDNDDGNHGEGNKGGGCVNAGGCGARKSGSGDISGVARPSSGDHYDPYKVLNDARKTFVDRVHFASEDLIHRLGDDVDIALINVFRDSVRDAQVEFMDATLDFEPRDANS